MLDLMIIEPLLELAWWGQIATIQPYCSYYFGPFASDLEAEFDPRWIEDLAHLGDQGITKQIKWCQPSNQPNCLSG